jgi:hypothetical protein
MVAGERECEETACLLLLLLTFVSMEIKRRRHVKLTLHWRCNGVALCLCGSHHARSFLDCVVFVRFFLRRIVLLALSGAAAAMKQAPQKEYGDGEEEEEDCVEGFLECGGELIGVEEETLFTDGEAVERDVMSGWWRCTL